jgi:hypothetical protein
MEDTNAQVLHHDTVRFRRLRCHQNLENNQHIDQYSQTGLIETVCKQPSNLIVCFIVASKIKFEIFIIVNNKF